VYSLMVVQSLIIVFDVCEVVTEGNVPKGKGDSPQHICCGI
jgi:hypothetical protein